jgi:3-methyladenine DNA glycosylase AlkD
VNGFDPDAAAEALAGTLRSLGTPGRAAQEKRYLKSDLEFFGVDVPAIRRAVKAAVRDTPQAGGGSDGRPDRQAAVAWAQALWRVPVHERRAAAVEILQLAVPRPAAGDLAVVEELIRDSRTWAYVDGLAANVAGGIALRDPASWQRIDRWAVDGDFWVRRSALLALLPGIRAGHLDLERFTRYAEPMLPEKEFFIRKAVGWVLREISRRDPQWVARWTGDRITAVSGVTFREAVRRLPPADRERLEQRRRPAPPSARTAGRSLPPPGKAPASLPPQAVLHPAAYSKARLCHSRESARHRQPASAKRPILPLGREAPRDCGRERPFPPHRPPATAPSANAPSAPHKNSATEPASPQLK